MFRTLRFGAQRCTTYGNVATTLTTPKTLALLSSNVDETLFNNVNAMSVDNAAALSRRCNLQHSLAIFKRNIETLAYALSKNGVHAKTLQGTLNHNIFLKH